MRVFERQQALILLAGGVIFVGFGLFRVIPILRHKQVLAKEMDQYIQSLEKMNTQSLKLPELKREKVQLEAQLPAFCEKIPEGRQFAQLWKQIADVMNECQLRDQLVQPGAEVKSGDLRCIPLKIECTGTLDQIFVFFQSLEAMDRLVCIESVQLENDSDFQARLKLNAAARVYYRPSASDKSTL